MRSPLSDFTPAELARNKVVKLNPARRTESQRTNR